MTKWVILLRVIGSVVLVIGGIGGVQYMVAMLGVPDTLYSLYNGGIWVLIHVPLAVICFAVAAALKQQQQQDRKLNYIANRLVSRSRRVGTNPYPPTDYPLPPSLQYPEPRDLAPDAPVPANTAHYADEGEKIRHNGEISAAPRSANAGHGRVVHGRRTGSDQKTPLAESIQPVSASDRRCAG